jgi:flagellar hook assembly protein FlgD
VATLVRGRVYAAGDNELRWDGRNTAGSHVASGVYLVRITTPLGARVARAVLLE